MNKTFGSIKYLLLFILFFPAENILAANGGADLVTFAIVALVGLILLAAFLLIGENLLQIESRRIYDDIDGTIEDPALLLPKRGAKISHKKRKGLPLHKLKKGYDISLKGKVEASEELPYIHTNHYAVQPKNFKGIAPIPKVLLNEGEEVLAGSPVFFDKSNPDIKYVSPVSGEYIELQRGEKRSINSLVILADKEIKHLEHTPPTEDASRDEIVKYLMETGGWVHINQRPYDIVPDPEIVPKNIFVSAFDSAPLAADSAVLIAGREAELSKGFEILSRLTEGKTYLGLNGNNPEGVPLALKRMPHVEAHYFKGAHPAGNVGVQIHHIAPINPGDTVWTLKLQDIITIGGLFLHGKYNSERVVAICGEQAKNPGYVKTHYGASISGLLENAVEENAEKTRIISGNVLTGEKKSTESFLNTFDSQLTLIPEGDYYEAFGWLVPQSMRPTVSRTFPNFLFKDLKYSSDTNTHGEKRAFVMTGQYEDLLPMNIYVQHLMKSIMINDVERMEGLGIHELSEEDIALCEFACTSKMPLQKILREGLDMMHSQT